jgi:hypothetical protein
VQTKFTTVKVELSGFYMDIDEIPKGIKLGERVVWYNGRVPVPGYVLKLYKNGRDKYTAVVKFVSHQWAYDKL